MPQTISSSFQVKVIIGFPNYALTNYGDIWRKSKKGEVKKLKPWKGHKGYLRVTLSRGGRKNRKHFYVHRLVAEYFLPDFKPAMDVHHKDSNINDNQAWNLEMVPHNGTHGRYGQKEMAYHEKQAQ